MTEPAFDIGSLHAFYRDGGSPVETIELALARLAAVDDPGIFISLVPKADLLRAAETLGAFDPVARPLWGIPFAVKDNIDVAGMATTAACPDFAYIADRDAHVVALLKAAGAIVIGKTNLDQFATGLVGVRSPYPIPRNALDPALVPGGSSSGSAVATAHGIVSFALGTDTAGSGRIPAGLNNIVGLKPSLGALSTRGVLPACRTLDCVSVFALTVEDAHAVFSVAAGSDEEDPYSRRFGTPVWEDLPPGLTIGVPAEADRRFFGDETMAAAYRDALGLLQGMGHRIVELPFQPFYEVADLLYEGAWVAERYAAVRSFFDAHADSFHPVTRQIYGKAKTLSAADAFDGLYRLKAYRNQLQPIIEGVDLICVPTAPRHYRLEELEAEPIRENSRLGTYTNFVNLLDLCGIAVPCGRRSDGLPASVTLLASAGKDGLAASLARAVQAAANGTLGATSWSLPAARAVAKPRDEDQRIPLVVVGAHLSGMPLNWQLTDRGGVFLRTAQTAPLYRLYELAGETPAKPGLLRVAEEEGRCVDVEIWGLTSGAFGDFVAAIPSPLGVGTVQLADGETAKGFLVESIAVAGARDISGFGGWRAFVQSDDGSGFAAAAR